jgi:hypothetical protein
MFGNAAGTQEFTGAPGLRRRALPR